MKTQADNEFQRRLEKELDQLFTDGVEKLVFRTAPENTDEWRGRLRAIREIGQLCKQIEKGMST